MAAHKLKKLNKKQPYNRLLFIKKSPRRNRGGFYKGQEEADLILSFALSRYF